MRVIRNVTYARKQKSRAKWLTISGFLLFALGFALAIYFGHGPGWAFPQAESVRGSLRTMLGLGRNADRPAH